MSGHERYEQFDTKAINKNFLSSESRLNQFSFRVRNYQNSHASHIIQELRFPRLLLIGWLFPYQFPKSTRNTRKTANKFMTVASGEIFTKYDLICHVAKMKDARSVNFMADVIFPSNPTL